MLICTGVEPRRPPETVQNLFLDLSATQEDHIEVNETNSLRKAMAYTAQTGNEQDITMQAGKQRATLPLIRRFNQHSERLLTSSLCVIV